MVTEPPTETAKIFPAGPAESTIDWDKCAVLVRERHVGKIAETLRSRADEWPQLAESARRAWESHFSESALLDSIAMEVAQMIREGIAESPLHLARVAAYWLERNSKLWVGSARTALRKKLRGKVVG